MAYVELSSKSIYNCDIVFEYVSEKSAEISLVAEPSKADFPESFYRNRNTFENGEIPGNYRLAEQYLGIDDNGIPRAAYFVLATENDGEPISKRVAASLKREFFSQTNSSKLNPYDAQVSLIKAQNYIGNNDFKAAVQEAAKVYASGFGELQDQAREILEKLTFAVQDYGDFAPAAEIKTIEISGEEITLPAAITDKDKTFIERNYAHILKQNKSKKKKG